MDKNISINIPDRNDSYPNGSKFVNSIMNLQMSQHREDLVLEQFLSGNVPDFLHNLVDITVLANGHRITYQVMPDVLSIGTDNDFVRIPMAPLTGQKIADAYGCCLPTKKMVEDIWKESAIKLEPQPMGPPYDSTMSSTERLVKHNQMVQDSFNAAGGQLGQLVSGHKKDVVITNQLSHPCKTVSIYGWIHKNGTVIQGLNAVSHSVDYYDYAHSIRLININVIVDGNDMFLKDVFKDPALCGLVSDEGAITSPFYN